MLAIAAVVVVVSVLVVVVLVGVVLVVLDAENRILEAAVITERDEEVVVIEEESEKENNVDNFSECRLLSVLQGIGWGIMKAVVGGGERVLLKMKCNNKERRGRKRGWRVAGAAETLRSLRCAAETLERFA